MTAFKKTKQREIVIHHYGTTAEQNGVNLNIAPPDPARFEERYAYSRNDGRGDNPVKPVPYSKDGRGVVPADSPLLRGHSSGEGKNLN